MKIVVAPNAFKGSLTAAEAALAMEAGIKNVEPDADVVRVPVADGGDGLVDVAVESLGGEIRTLEVTGPLFEPVSANYCYVRSRDLVIVEMALSSGLALVPESLRDPARTTSFGTGELIRAGLDLGVGRINVGIGGSATNDGGMGMAQALGVRFLDQEGKELPGIGASLGAVAAIDMSNFDSRVGKTRIEAVCDVENPLCGPNGAAHVYGPQKGADLRQVQELDRGMQNFAAVIRRDLGLDVESLPGAGAAGGMGAGLHAFLGAGLRKGIDLIFELVGLREKMVGADLVFTGEGQIDYQTVFGKAPGGVGVLSRELGIPCLAIAGSIGSELGDLHACGITSVFSLCSGPLSLAEAMADSRKHITRAIEQVLRCFLAGCS